MADHSREEFNNLLAGVEFGTMDLPAPAESPAAEPEEVSVDVQAEGAVKKMVKLAGDSLEKLVPGHGFTMGLILLVDERDGSWSYWKSNMDVNDILAYTERLKFLAQRGERSKE